MGSSGAQGAKESTTNMTTEAQLGRSVLESKERTELQAIAEQLSVKATSRMKKADLIDEILSAAGVDKAPAKPAGRAPKAAKAEDAVDDSTSSAPRTGRRCRRRRHGPSLHPTGQNGQGRNNNRNGEPGNRRNNNRRRGRGRDAIAASVTCKVAQTLPTKASSSSAVASWTSATRAMASCAARATCQARRTSTFRSANRASLPCAREMPSKGVSSCGQQREVSSTDPHRLVSGMDPEEARNRRRFEDLTPLFPDEKLALETPGDSSNMTARIVDLLSPIGKGQAWIDRLAPEGGKDNRHEADRPFDREEQPRSPLDGAFGRRAS